jgi:hypothetical protein
LLYTELGFALLTGALQEKISGMADKIISLKQRGTEDKSRVLLNITSIDFQNAQKMFKSVLQRTNTIFFLVPRQPNKKLYAFNSALAS